MEVYTPPTYDSHTHIHTPYELGCHNGGGGGNLKVKQLSRVYMEVYTPPYLQNKEVRGYVERENVDR